MLLHTITVEVLLSVEEKVDIRDRLSSSALNENRKIDRLFTLFVGHFFFESLGCSTSFWVLHALPNEMAAALSSNCERGQQPL